MAEEKDVQREIESIRSQAEGFLQQSNFLKALQVAITAPNGGSKDQDTAAQTVSNVLNGIKEADMGKILDQLSEDERVHVLRFTYRGMALAQNCAPLLRWNNAIYDKDGAGAIMRVLVNRN